MKCLNIALILTLVHFATSAPTLEQQWTEFKTNYKRQYSDWREELKRFKIFSDNLDKIEEHNAKYRNGETTFHMKMNKFGDLTANEFLSFVNRTNSRKPVIPEENLKPYVRTIGPRAAEVDWRTQGAVSPVSDELECDSSWAFSAIGALEGQIAIKTGTLPILSAQNLVDCSTGNSGCAGGLQSESYNYMQANGIMTEADYPYTGEEGTCRFDASKSAATVTGYVTVNAQSEGHLLNAVEGVGPIASTIHATWYFQFYYGGVMYDNTCSAFEDDINHSVLVVGYGTQFLFDFWISKNSWGTDWGENGYFLTIRNYGNNCGIATRTLYPEIA